jgi:hypothetical protein
MDAEICIEFHPGGADSDGTARRSRKGTRSEEKGGQGEKMEHLPSPQKIDQEDEDLSGRW